MENKIESIMEDFNFNKVHTAMKSVGWSWHFKGVPSVYQLIRHAKEDLERVADADGELHVSSGGFRAGKDEYGELYLEFIMEGLYSGDL